MDISLTVEGCCPVAEIVAAYRREGDAVRRSHHQVSTAEQNGTAVAVQKGTTWRLWACPRSP